MSAYYNEIDPYAAQWLRNLIKAGHIAPGDVDERSIVDVRPDDLRGYTQAHFFAGIGGWSVALRLADWPDDRPVWTGSCPCQPFSAAGAGKAGDDERHLWPAWFPLIAERRPAVVFGEQVEAAIGWGWLDVVFADLESEGYACGATVLPACSVGAPHIRNRAWFVANAVRATGQRGAGSVLGAQASIGGAREFDGCEPDGLADGGEARNVADATSGGFREQRDASQPRRGGHADGGGIAGKLGNPRSKGCKGGEPQFEDGSAREAGRSTREPSRAPDHWADVDWLPCTDGKTRPVRPGSFPLAHGIQRRTSKLRAFGNAIVPQVAAEFIAAASEVIS